MLYFKVATTFIISTVFLSRISATLTFKAKSAKPVDITKEVNKNFRYLVNLIENDSGWLRKILLQIKKELKLRKTDQRIKTKCEWCLIELHSEKGGQHIKQMVEMDSKNDLSDLMIRNLLKIRVRRSVPPGIAFHPRPAKNSIREKAQSEMLEVIDEEAAQDDEDEDDIYNDSSDEPQILYPSIPVSKTPALNSGLKKKEEPGSKGVNVSSLKQLSPKFSSLEVRKVNQNKSSSAENDSSVIGKDDKGRAIVKCDEEKSKDFCLNNGVCMKVKIIEFETCWCSKGFGGRRCQLYDVMKAINIFNDNSEVRSIRNISKPNRRLEMESALTATSLYTINAYIVDFED